MSIEVKRGSTRLNTSVPKILFQTSIHVSPFGMQYCATGNGKKFLLGEPVGESRELITVVLNWPAHLSHR
jgi:hypothetical protein